MNLQIILIRHGEPEYALIGRARADQVADIIHNYDSSTIKGTVDSATLAAVSAEHFVVCSDLRRSIDSAKALGLQPIHLSSPLFREIELPYFKHGKLTMSVLKWAVLLRLLSIFGFSRNGESMRMAQSRAEKAAAQLMELAQKNQQIVLVGHAIINYLIARQLRKNHWQGPAKPGSDYWGFGVFTKS